MKNVTKPSQRVYATVLCAMLMACASPAPTPTPSTHLTLLPEPDGKASAIQVQSLGGGVSVTLDSPYTALDVSNGRIVPQPPESAASVAQRYPDLLSALPTRPTSSLLFAKTGSTELTEVSEKDLNQLIQQLKTLPFGELVLIGHTDTMGSDSANDALSLSRANALKQRLVASGIAADRVTSIGKGKRQLLVQTADQVDEPRNRRLEVILR